MFQVGPIKTENWVTISKAYYTCGKGDEQILKLIRFWIDIQLHRASWVRVLYFVTIFRKTIVSFFMRTINDFDHAVFSSVGFVIAEFNAVLIFEMILNSLGSKLRIQTNFGEDFNRNEIFIDVTVSRVIYSVKSMIT